MNFYGCPNEELQVHKEILLDALCSARVNKEGSLVDFCLKHLSKIESAFDSAARLAEYEQEKAKEKVTKPALSVVS
mgnify:CR=1 FL=1